VQGGPESLSFPDIERVHQTLSDGGLIEPLTLGGADEATWLDCELSSLAENRLGERADPMRLDDETREGWLKRATVESLYRPSDRDIDRCYWLVDGGVRVGTVALATDLLGSDAIRLASLYVAPSFRGRGIGRRILRATRDAAGEENLGMRLTTSWAWQRTLRLYISLGMWVRAWKREIELSWCADESPPILEASSDLEVRLTCEERGALVEIARARRSEDQLLLRFSDGLTPSASTTATSTLALLLALRGWPLVRSAADWRAHHLADAGAPEGLAYRIMVWEAWDRSHGYKVDTPRIRGLSYPSWEEIEAAIGH